MKIDDKTSAIASLPNKSDTEQINNNGDIGDGNKKLIENCNIRRSNEDFTPWEPLVSVPFS